MDNSYKGFKALVSNLLYKRNSLHFQVQWHLCDSCLCQRVRQVEAVSTCSFYDNRQCFENAITGTPYDPYIPYASKENTNSYISTADGSLNKDNYAGAEYVYLVLNEIYGTEAVSTEDVSSVSLIVPTTVR